MDERNAYTSVATASSDTELATAAVRQPDHPAHQPVTTAAESAVVYCGTAESVREGLAGAELDAGEQ